MHLIKNQVLEMSFNISVKPVGMGLVKYWLIIFSPEVVDFEKFCSICNKV